MQLGDRQKLYEKATDYEIIRRVPVIIRVDGRKFSSLTKKLPRPFCPKMLNLMSDTMINSIKNIDGAIFGYQQSDEITFVLRNDQSLDSEPWFGNRIQKICSITAALVTLNFNNLLKDLQDPPVLLGQAIFDARVFALPSALEVANNLIFRQHDCIRNAITSASRAELSNKFGKKTTDKILKGKNTAERKHLLFEECGIDFETYYPSSFKFGTGAYKVAKIVGDEENQLTRHRWILDSNLPKFSDDKSRSFILGIINSGKDIFRPERDLKEEA